MPIVELLTLETAGVAAKFVLKQVDRYLGKKYAGKAPNLKKEVDELKPFKEKLEVNDADLKKIKENVEKISEKLVDMGLDITREKYEEWCRKSTDETLTTMGSGSAKPFFRVDVWTDKETGESVSFRDVKIIPKKHKRSNYGIGDKIIIYFRSDRDCYLTLFNIGTSGKVTILFPNSLFQNNFIKGGKIYAIPGDEYPFEYELSGPLGVEKIKAIATTSKQDLMKFDFSGKEFFHSVESDIATRDISIVAKKVEKVPVNNLAESMCEFEVR